MHPHWPPPPPTPSSVSLLHNFSKLKKKANSDPKALRKKLLKPKMQQVTLQAVSEWVSERVLREDKNLSTGLTMSDP